MPPMPSPSPSATSTRGRIPPRRRARLARSRARGVSTGRPDDPVIAWLRGRIVEKQPNRLIVDVQGVGYEVHVPLSTFYEAGDAEAAITLRVHTHVREDALHLYGFLTTLEQQVFERLIGISGIG